MAVTIKTDECIACGACVDECPNSALSVEDVCVVDGFACIDCGICVETCPVSAIES